MAVIGTVRKAINYALHENPIVRHNSEAARKAAEKAAKEALNKADELILQNASKAVEEKAPFLKRAYGKLKGFFRKNKEAEGFEKKTEHEFHGAPKTRKNHTNPITKESKAPVKAEEHLESRLGKLKKRTKEFFESKSLRARTQNLLDDLARGGRKFISEYNLAKLAPKVKNIVKSLQERAQKLKQSAFEIIIEQKERKIEFAKKLFKNSVKLSFESNKKDLEQLTQKLVRLAKEKSSGWKDKAKTLAGYIKDKMANLSVDAKYGGMDAEYNIALKGTKEALTTGLRQG